MEFPKIGTPLGSFLVTCCLWVWTLKKGKAHIFQQELVLRDQNRSASWAFIVCLALQASYSFFESARWLLSLVAFLTFFIFAITSNRCEESFWRKRRNAIFAGIIGLILFSCLPYLFVDLYFVPLIGAIAISHLAHRRFIGIFSNNLRDLKALQAKILRHDANRKNERILPGTHTHMAKFSEPMETIA